MIKAERLNELAALAAEDSRKHGFEDYNKPVWRTLVKASCEVVEAVEAYRDKRNAGMASFISAQNLSESIPYGDKIRAKMYNKLYDQMVKNTVQDEMSDAFIYLLVAAGNIHADLTIPDRNREKEITEYIRNHDFVERAGYLMRMMLVNHEYTDVWKTIVGCLDYITIWMREEYDQDIEFWVTSKMAYNLHRPYRHGRKTDPTL